MTKHLDPKNQSASQEEQRWPRKLNRPAILFNLVFLFGMLLGFLLPSAPQYVLHWRYNRVLGLDQLITKADERELIVKAYETEVDLSQISFNPPNIPTPFVGTAPRPGHDRNAFINHQQFRYDHQIEEKKAEGEIRLFLVGGSTAYGAGASSQEKTIAGFLEHMLQEHTRRFNVRVITAANTGWSSTHERIWIVNRLLRFSPDLVISLTGVNDIHYGALGLEPVEATSPHENFYRNIVTLVYKTSFFSSLPRMNVPRKERVRCEEITEQAARNHAISHVALREQGAHLNIFLQPALQTSRKSLTERERRALEERNHPYFHQCAEMLRKKLKEKVDAPVVSLKGIFDDRSASEEIFLDSYHFGDRGNRIIAEHIFAEIISGTENIFIPSSEMRKG